MIMASVEAFEIQEEQNFMKDFWNLRKKYHEPEEPDGYWEGLMEDIEKISRKYNSLYVDMLLCCCLGDIEIRSSKEQGSKFLRPDIEQLRYLKTVFKNISQMYDEHGNRIGGI